MNARFKEFELDPARRQLLRNGREVHLAPKAFDLLAVLVDEAPRVMRKDELHARLWPGTFVSDATLVGLIKELRRALDDTDRAARIVRTAHGVGYGFACAIERVGPAPSTGIARWVVVGRRRIPLDDGENLIGRDPMSTIHLDATGISRRHARIVVSGESVLLEDLASKNGTLVNDAPVSGSVELRDGDCIHVGPVAVLYHASPSGISTDTILRRRP